jgi:hypothetical protein
MEMRVFLGSDASWMTSSVARTVLLTRHPETPADAVCKIEARVSWTENEALAVTYLLTGDLSRLSIPPFRRPRRADRLWEHTCFETFLGIKGKPEYYEFNFAPSGEWSAYVFRAYRDGAPLKDKRVAPGLTVRSSAGSLALDVVIRADRLPIIAPRARLRIALSAVVEDDSGRLSYWALTHPPGKPDFHHSDAFALEIEAPDMVGVKKSRKAK